MKRLLTLVIWFAALFSSSISAQTWTFYVSAERDFRVLLPGPPTRVTTLSGSVGYRTDTGSHRYSIFRHDPRRIANAAAARDDIILRITSDEQRASNIGQDDGDLAPNEFMFRVGRLQDYSSRHLRIRPLLRVSGASRTGRRYFTAGGAGFFQLFSDG